MSGTSARSWAARGSPRCRGRARPAAPGPTRAPLPAPPAGPGADGPPRRVGRPVNHSVGDGQYPSEQAVLKVLWLAVPNLEKFRAPTWDPQVRVETGVTNLHDRLRGANPHTTTDATITPTDDRTPPHGASGSPSAAASRDRAERRLGVAEICAYVGSGHVQNIPLCAWASR